MKHQINLMRRLMLVAMIFLLSASVWAQQSNYREGVRQGMVKVKFAPTMTQSLSQMQVNTRNSKLSTGISNFDKVAEATKATNMYRLFPYNPKTESKLRKHGLHLWYVVEIDQDVDPKMAIQQFKQLKEVAIAETDHEKTLAPYTVKPYNTKAKANAAMPFNDPYLADQWHYDNTGQTGYDNGADVNLFEAWTTTTGANNVIVAVHDQGVDVGHEDLQANMWVNEAEKNGQAGVDDDGNGYKDDINGWNYGSNSGVIDGEYHGTHVAGTVAAVNNNGKGVSGVAGGDGSGNGARIMSLQILSGGLMERSYIYAADNGAVISQNSWGYTSPGYVDQSVMDAIAYFIAEAGNYAGSPMKGGLVIFAAGNSNWDAEWYPGYNENILSVASLSVDWTRAPYSNFGTWVDIAAPGGASEYGVENNILSTSPNNKYAYLEGTSMACPHVSGIAALALANSDKQLTNTELWNKLVTGIVNIDSYNPDFLGKIGVGAIDAKLAIRNDLKIVPNAISDLALEGIAQEFATLSWTVPIDGDDDRPNTFELYYHTEAITAGNLSAATKVVIKNTAAAGTAIDYEVSGLLGLTTYHFALTSTDRWGNISLVSNVITGTTNAGPAISVDANSQEINLTIDASLNTSASHPITIMNGAEGILRWSHNTRHRSTSLAWNAANINYPSINKRKPSSNIEVAMRNSGVNSSILKSNIAPSAFSQISKNFVLWTTNIVGETDTALTNSAAAKFFVTEENGFNLTQVQMYLKHDPAKGPVVMEIYQGTISKQNLVYAQEHSNWGTDESNAYITLNEQVYFESGSTFWVVFHVPSGNLYPLGIGPEAETDGSKNCLMSFDLGGTWMPLEEALNSKDFAWSVAAISGNAHLGTYLTLSPESGDVLGNQQGSTTLTADGANLINGSYQANLILKSNDAQNQELRIPVNLTVSGHQPHLVQTDLVNFDAVFIGGSKAIEILIENQGFGNFNNPSFSIDNTNFSIDGSAPWQIKAREEAILKIKFSPNAAGNSNGRLTITDGNQTYYVALFGVGAETSKIALSPESQIVSNLAIGDEVIAQVKVQNTGAYPLKYFVPGYDDKGISNNWPSDFHSYGYKFRSNYANESNPAAYEFQDISETGKSIVSEWPADDAEYYALDMGFEFPYYGENMQTLYIAQKGFTTFDNSVRAVNTPNFPGNIWSPKGIISPIGTYLSYVAQGEIFVQVEADRVIVQFDNVGDGWNLSEYITAQMVLYADGNIRFFYEDVTYSEWNTQYLSIFIEDLAQQDGVLISEYSSPSPVYSGLTLGFDYPGPNIITAVSNGSGMIMPGDSAMVDITLSTSSLVEGTVNRYISFINNDPDGQTSALVQLEITSGGTEEAVVSIDSVAFGDVFVGETLSQIFTIKNPGTANLDLTGITFANNDFSVSGNATASIKPGLYEKYSIEVPTANISSLEDWLFINYANGNSDSIYLSANIIAAPGIEVDLSVIQDTLAHDETSTHELSIHNSGLNNLEIVATGKQWLNFEPTNATQTPDVTYIYEKNNDGSGYQWLDIRETGTQTPFWTGEEDGSWWRELELPFPINYYGQNYSTVYLAENGVIAFEPQEGVNFFTDQLPTDVFTGPLIMPYWTFGGFSDYIWAIEDIGIFYKFEDDKIIITWSYFVNNFGGMGDPVSAQAIFYKNGTMKFQYKAEEYGADATSQFSLIGLQKDANSAIVISGFQALDYGTGGLAYFIMPAVKHTVAPGNTLEGLITLDAQNIYGGQYNKNLTINTNVPGSKTLVKPVELTVTGTPSLMATDTVDFGKQLVKVSQWGDPEFQYVDMYLENNGAAQLDITWAEITNIDPNTGYTVSGLNFMMEVDGWFGKEWSLISNIYSPWAWETPVFSIKPGDKLKVRAAFGPTVSGDVTDHVVLTTNIGTLTVAMKGSGFEPPVIEVTNTPINVTMNTLTETAAKSIAFNNTNGKSDLEYSISIDFGRATGASVSSEAMATSAALGKLVNATAVGANNAKQAASYNRTLKHNDKDTADTWVGIGGASTFTLASRFNAGAEGFNLSHIETFFRPETLREGTITLEVRAGGNNIVNASVVGHGSINFSTTSDDMIGGWKQIALEKAAGIYPNEDFYVILTYPLGIQLPQGTVEDVEAVEGRYYYESEGNWFDVQNENGFGTMGWQLYAAEETAGNFTWLNVTSSKQGSLAVGAASTIELSIQGAVATRGDQVANVVITHNDINKSTIRVPVSLHMNEAPSFMNVPAALLMAEKDTMTVVIAVSDVENNAITLEAAQAYEGVVHEFNGSNLSITITPDYGDAGFYDYTYIATDTHGASKEVTVSVEVVHTNQAPVYIGTAEPMEYNATGNISEYMIADFFSDPDQDAFTFNVTSSNEGLVEVFANQSKFFIRPLAIGETAVNFTVTDENGGVTHHTISVVVNKILGVEDALITNASVYPNPVKNKVMVTLSTQWSGNLTLEIVDASGRTQLSQMANASENREINLDLTSLANGFYVLKINSGNLQNSIKLIKE